MCPSRACPNWAVRPYQDPGNDGGKLVSAERQEAIRRAREARVSKQQADTADEPADREPESKT